MKMKGTPLHAACVVGDTVGDPYKDTSSVAMNPVIKFTTLFGLLAAGLGHSMSRTDGGNFFAKVLAFIFFGLMLYFVWRSFYRMRIDTHAADRAQPGMATPYRSPTQPLTAEPPAATAAPIVAAAAAGAAAAVAAVAATSGEAERAGEASEDDASEDEPAPPAV
jgi:K(+)-stimulated pyrophosphate-energized sodium pump